MPEGRKRGQNRYSPEQKRKIQQILEREQRALRVPPVPAAPPRDLGKRDLSADAAERVGPNVVSKFFYNKVVNQRNKDFWKKPWGRKKVDLPLPSYLRDFKDADTHLLEPHFSHYRRNVGISKDATASASMMRALSAPLGVPGPMPETQIYSNHALRPPARLPMVALPPRTPLENTIQMNERATENFAQTHGALPRRSRGKTRKPEKLNAFIDELTEAYALCSAHEQLKAEIVNIQARASAKAGVALPPLPTGQQVEQPIGMLKTILSKSNISGKGL